MSAAALALVAVAGMVAAAGAGCTSAGPLLSVTSARNATGHVVTTVRLQQETWLPAGVSAVALDVHPTTTLCGDDRTDALHITLHTPPPPPPSPPPPPVTPPSSPPLTTMRPPLTQQETGYENITGFGYYKFHREFKTWHQAKATCEDEDAHLLILNSDAEAAAIQKHIEPYPHIGFDWIFIGFHDFDKEGYYTTIFAEDLASTGYLRWQSGQPNNLEDVQDCGCLNRNTMELNDCDCNWPKYFICEQSVA